MTMRSLLYASAMLIFWGCSGSSRVTPVPAAAMQAGPATLTPDSKPTTLKRICIIENNRVRSDFLDAYKAALSSRGYQVEVFQKTPQVSQCPLTTRYVAYWGVDGIVPYMRHAELRVFREGNPAGRAVYQARAGMFSSDVEPVVRRLVDQLLPKSE